MKEEHYNDLKATLEKWKKVIDDSDVEKGRIIDFLGDTENSLVRAIEIMQHEYTVLVAQITGIPMDALCWFWLENEFGNLGRMAGTSPDGSDFMSCGSIDDFIKLNEETI